MQGEVFQLLNISNTVHIAGRCRMLAWSRYRAFRRPGDGQRTGRTKSSYFSRMSNSPLSARHGAIVTVDTCNAGGEASQRNGAYRLAPGEADA